MQLRNVLAYVLSFAVHVLLQAVFLRHAVFFEVAACLFYVNFLLSLPADMNRLGVIASGFALGLTVDVFYDTPGVQAAACTLVAYVRGGLLDSLKPTSGYDLGQRPEVAELGAAWYVRYALTLIVLHHLACFGIEYGSVSLLPRMLVNALATAALTFGTVFGYHYVQSFSGRRGR